MCVTGQKAFPFGEVSYRAQSGCVGLYPVYVAKCPPGLPGKSLPLWGRWQPGGLTDEGSTKKTISLHYGGFFRAKFLT